MSPHQKNFDDADIPSLEYGMFNNSFHTKMDFELYQKIDFD